MAYKDITIPDDRPPGDYSYGECRAELLQFSIEAGYPDMLSRKRFAERYDVAPLTITCDVQALREEIADEIGTDADLISYVVYQKALRAVVQREE
jgi:hypothetical protein